MWAPAADNLLVGHDDHPAQVPTATQADSAALTSNNAKTAIAPCRLLRSILLWQSEKEPERWHNDDV